MPKKFNPDKLVVGKRYRVRFSTGLSTKEMVATYLGETRVRHRTLAFDLRPEAGTQVLAPREILGVWVAKEKKHQLPKTIQPEKREKRVF